MTRAPDPTSKVEVGKRLALTRKALGHTTTKMCKLMGSNSGGSAWSNYEGGWRCISRKQALKLCKTCGLTLPWIYQGHIETLPEELQKKIKEVTSERDSVPAVRPCAAWRRERGPGRPKLNNTEQLLARLPKGTLRRIEKALRGQEKQADFARAAIEAELRRRARPTLDELLADHDPATAPRDEEWERMPPVGHEII